MDEGIRERILDLIERNKFFERVEKEKDLEPWDEEEKKAFDYFLGHVRNFYRERQKKLGKGKKDQWDEKKNISRGKKEKEVLLEEKEKQFWS